jgi:hypothetical protein
VTTSSHLILVLWGQGFDEIAASIFVAELRRLGKRVKLVGLNSQQIAGQHGVTLVPDLPLGQALRAAHRIQCVIVPAPYAALAQFSYDPRLAELLGLANHQHALLVVDTLPPLASPLSSALSASPSDAHASASTSQLLAYPATTELMPFVHTVLAPRLE